jgi:hypothetical protein
MASEQDTLVSPAALDPSDQVFPFQVSIDPEPTATQSVVVGHDIEVSAAPGEATTDHDEPFHISIRPVSASPDPGVLRGTELKPTAKHREVEGQAESLICTVAPAGKANGTSFHDAPDLMSDSPPPEAATQCVRSAQPIEYKLWNEPKPESAVQLAELAALAEPGVSRANEANGITLMATARSA